MTDRELEEIVLSLKGLPSRLSKLEGAIAVLEAASKRLESNHRRQLEQQAAVYIGSDVAADVPSGVLEKMLANKSKAGDDILNMQPPSVKALEKMELPE